ncbi:hypothetical protein [Polyangium mundeleinium]|uniref:Secreted protein n=1 Tax=Polyangium mundeleinium TaxID=2995306 RepID=A0ABT5EYV3_9BACT|nr:hypothetical protein [Polyangium mundeleinium]MDC0746452.1 hypothetical protein [Polyangium mundeleinium]
MTFLSLLFVGVSPTSLPGAPQAELAARGEATLEKEASPRKTRAGVTQRFTHESNKKAEERRRVDTGNHGPAFIEERKAGIVNARNAIDCVRLPWARATTA